ncbi:hypothetical protein MY1884_004079 [Beauveria asiatica]
MACFSDFGGSHFFPRSSTIDKEDLPLRRVFDHFPDPLLSPKVVDEFLIYAALGDGELPNDPLAEKSPGSVDMPIISRQPLDDLRPDRAGAPPTASYGAGLEELPECKVEKDDYMITGA